MSIRLTIDPVVHVDHDHSWEPETDGGRNQGVGLVDGEGAVLLISAPGRQVLAGCVPTGEDRQEGHKGWTEPGCCQHRGGASVGHYQGVVERAHDSVVSKKVTTGVGCGKLCLIEVEYIPVY